METSFNPVYGTSIHDDETEYSTVKKKKPLGSGHIAPVVIQAPVTSYYPDEEAPEEVRLVLYCFTEFLSQMSK